MELVKVQRANFMGVVKRDGSADAWNRAKVMSAVLAAMRQSGEGDEGDADLIARLTERSMLRLHRFGGKPSVEAVSDEAERQMMSNGYPKAAKAFILYREERARARGRASEVPEEMRRLARESSAYFPNALSEFVYYRTYSRWRDDLRRRETWLETVERYVGFMFERLGDSVKPNEYESVRQAILKMEVMPSMRLLWSAGAAARATNVAAFNCSYLAPRELKDFGEMLYILACGTGVGFSAESRNVQLLPVVQRQANALHARHYVEDSKEGWADALVRGLEHWFDGTDVDFDFSGVRPEGARLRTMGGRSSGPRLLEDLLRFARRLVLSRQGRRLSNIDVHDLACKIGECIVSGGVRRSALISLSDPDDEQMRRAKDGHFYLEHGHRSLANNSAAYDERPPAAQFMREWLALAESGSGERGIFNRGGLESQVPLRRLSRWHDMGAGEFVSNGAGGDFRLTAQVGTNPCGEIILLHKQFCNLTEVVCRASDTAEELARKTRIAALLGTYQSMLTDFPYLSSEWKKNCEAERLLGVSLTGQWDCPALRDPGVLTKLRDQAVQANEDWSVRFGIEKSSAVTCGKPSGTVSQLVDASSGGHPRFARHYVRRVRISSSDPLFRMLKDQGFKAVPEVGQQADTATTWVLEFPAEAPVSGPFAPGVSALEQLKWWKRVKTEFCEHNPSVTVYVGPDEWVDVGHWVWDNWEIVGGLSFLPRDGGVYRLAPYEELDAAQHARLVEGTPAADYAMIAAYERDDETEGSKELACVAGACEIGG